MTTLTATPAGLGFSSSDSVSVIHTVAIELQSAPYPIGGSIAKIHAATIGDSGEVAFSTSLSDSSAEGAILLASSGVTRVLLQAGEDAAGGGRYKAFNDLDLAQLYIQSSSEDVLLFRAELEGGPASEGVFLWRPQGVELFALAGQKSPRGNIYKSFSSLTIAAAGPSAPNFKMAFVAVMENGGKSVIFRDSGGNLFEVLSTGDALLSKEVVEDFVISRIGFSLSCVAQVQKKKNHFKKVITLDAFLLPGNALAEGVRFPTLGKVKRIFDPPAMKFQQGYAAVEFKNGVTALATRDVDGASEVFAKSGDAAPDLSGETIRRFGPPISSSFQLRMSDEFGEFSGPFGIVSPVGLSGGGTALWVGVFIRSVPSLEGERMLLLVNGNAISDGQEIVLRSFAPVKLTNNGTLLLRGTVEDGGCEREGLFVIEVF